jgi:hypothetical protein
VAVEQASDRDGAVDGEGGDLLVGRGGGCRGHPLIMTGSTPRGHVRWVSGEFGRRMPATTGATMQTMTRRAWIGLVATVVAASAVTATATTAVANHRFSDVATGSFFHRNLDPPMRLARFAAVPAISCGTGFDLSHCLWARPRASVA